MVLLRQLIDAGARVKAYDPVAMENASRELPAEWIERAQVQFARQQYDVVDDADALILITEWLSFRSLDIQRLASGMRSRIIFDGRNQYDPAYLRAQGFEYFGIGR